MEEESEGSVYEASKDNNVEEGSANTYLEDIFDNVSTLQMLVSERGGIMMAKQTKSGFPLHAPINASAARLRKR